MDAAWAGLLGAAVGALAGFGGAAVTARATTRAEASRRADERAAERERETRVAVGQLAGLIARAVQAMDWFAWQAAHRAASFDATTVDEYDRGIREQFPMLMEASARVAAIDARAYGRFSPYLEELFGLDRALYRASSGSDADLAGVTGRIAALQDVADDLAARFQAELAAWSSGAGATTG